MKRQCARCPRLIESDKPHDEYCRQCMQYIRAEKKSNQFRDNRFPRMDGKKEIDNVKDWEIS